MAGAGGERKIIVRVLDLNLSEIRLQSTSAELVYNVMMHITHGAPQCHACMRGEAGGETRVTHPDPAGVTSCGTYVIISWTLSAHSAGLTAAICILQ